MKENFLKERKRIRRQIAPRDGPFICTHCGKEVCATTEGTEHRNHCPSCLWSLHLDRQSGDRAAGCGGAMEPIAVWVRRSGEWAVVHRCRECGVVRVNRIAGDDNQLALISLAARPLAKPPFPLDGVTPGADRS